MLERSIAVRHSRIHGRGVFALRRIPKDRAIIRYRGKLISHEQADAQGPDDGHTFLFILNDDYVIDASQGGNAARWINHSCAPNCIAYLIESPTRNRRLDKIVIESLRAIAPGEELTYDYRIDSDNPDDPVERRLWVCRCGASKCRGTMLRARKKKKR